MNDKEKLLEIFQKARFTVYEETEQTLYIKGRWGGVDFYFNDRGALIGGRVLGDECDLFVDKKK